MNLIADAISSLPPYTVTLQLSVAANSFINMGDEGGLGCATVFACAGSINSNAASLNLTASTHTAAAADVQSTPN
jgi:hypothetical protein